MEKRILVAFLLSFAVLYGFRFLYPPVVPETAPTNEATASTEAVEVPSNISEPVEPEVTDAQELVESESVEDVVVNTENYRAIVSNQGGVLKSFRLTHYADADKQSIEIVDAFAAQQVGFPLSLVTGDSAVDKVLAEAKFVVHREPDSVSLEYQGHGLHAEKTLVFDPQKYRMTVSSHLSRNGTAIPHSIVWQGEFGDQSVDDVAAKRHVVYYSTGKFRRLPLPSIKEEQELTGSMVGVEDQYFLAMFLRDTEGIVKVNKQTYKLPDLPDGTKGAEQNGLYLAVPMGTEPLEMYVGPKLEQSLTAVRSDLGGVIDFGWYLFAVIAKPLLVGLRWVHSFTGNWGWAIIILTILINMILFPLRIKQQLATQRMQKNAPHLRQLQDKYKKLKPGDPKRAEVERELMEINKQQLSGCLPMLIQMPLLFAFLNMMTASIELRGAPWILWVGDLSQADPLYILPILMGVAMFVQMKMSPTSPDPAQAKIMLVTPVLVTLLFLWYRSASGLTLYWLTGNVISIGQQWFIRNYWPDGDGGKPSVRRRQPAPA